MMLLAQFVGLVGILLLIAIFQVNDRKAILRLQVVSCLVWAFYYVLLEAYTAAGLITLGAIRSYFFEHYRDKEWFYPITIVAFALATLVTWENWTSMLAFVGIVLATTALWQRNPRAIRMLSLTVTPFSLTYNYLGGSYLGVVGDLVTFSSVIIAIWRFDLMPYIRQRKQQSAAAEPIEASLI